MMVFLVEKVEKNNHTELYLFSRDSTGKKSVEVISSFRPYFYIPFNQPVPDDWRITEVSGIYKGISGETLKRVYTRNSKHVSEVRQNFSKHYEADILFEQRYLIDVLGETKAYPLKILYLDIELNTFNKFPDMKDPDQEITCISLVDSFNNIPFTLFLECKENEGKIKSSESIKVCKTEVELLEGIITYMLESDPDVLSGWNSNGFDLTYIVRRMNKLGVDARKLSPLYSVYFNEYNDRLTIKGRLLMDMLPCYRHFRKVSNQGQAESYSLEFTAQEVLKKGKLAHKEGFREMWQKNPDKFIEYNIRDITLTKEINDKLKIIEFFQFITSKGCSRLDSIFQTSTIVDGFLLRKVHGSLVLPSKPGNKSGDMFSGAFVLLPKPGLYDNLIVLDVHSMYPNLIKTFNINFETYNPDGKIVLEENLKFDKGIGLISGILYELEKDRKINKDLMKQADKEGKEDDRLFYHFRQYAIKVLMNSMYGYLGYPNSRLYKREVAEAVTKMGQKLIKHTIELLEQNEYKVIYSDTDSVYIVSKGKTLEEVLEDGKNVRDKINKSYIDFSASFGAEKCTLEMEFEKALKKVLFVSKKGMKEGAKKKYAYIPLWYDGKTAKDKVEFTGFSSVRSDTPRIARKVQKEVIEMILRGTTREKVVEYLREIEKKVRTKEIPDDEISFPKGISNSLEAYGQEDEVDESQKSLDDNEKVKGKKKGIPPVIKGCIYSNRYLGTQFDTGSKPKWIYIKMVPDGYPSTDVISFEEKIPEGFLPDYDMMCERIFKNNLEAIFLASEFGEFPRLNSSVKTLDMWGAV